MELTLTLPSGDRRIAMVGSGERNLKIIREALGVSIAARDTTLRISGDSRSVGQAAHVLEQFENNRLIRPKSEYVGETGRTWPK